MTDSKTKKAKIIDYSNQHDIGLMEEICRAGKAKVLFRTTNTMNLPVQLVKLTEPVSFVSRGSIQKASVGDCVAAYKTPKAVHGSYYLAVLKDPLTVQQLCRTYCKKMTKGNNEMQAVFSLPFKEEILKSNPEVFVLSDSRPSKKICVSEIRLKQDVDCEKNGKTFHYKVGSYIPVLNAAEVERMSMYYYKASSKKREVEQILFALPTAQVLSRSIAGVEVSKKAKILLERSSKKGVRKILHMDKDATVIVTNADNALHSMPFRLVKGQTIALIEGRYPETLTMCVVLPEDLHDLRLKLRYSDRYSRQVSTVTSQHPINAALYYRKIEENQRN